MQSGSYGEYGKTLQLIPLKLPKLLEIGLSESPYREFYIELSRRTMIMVVFKVLGQLVLILRC